MGAIVLLCLTAATLLTGVYLVSQNTRFFVFGCALALLALASSVVEFLTASPYFSIARRIGEILFLGLIISVILWHVVTDREVTSETLHGAVCVYLLSGLLWASLYLLLEGLDPGSFYVGSRQNPDQTLDRTIGGDVPAAGLSKQRSYTGGQVIHVNLIQKLKDTGSQETCQCPQAHHGRIPQVHRLRDHG